MTSRQITRRVDAHMHLWQLARGDYDWMSPALGPIHRDFGIADAEPLLRACDLQEVVLVQAAATVAETTFLLSLAPSSPRIAGVVGWVDFESPDAPATLQDFARLRHFKGVRPMIQSIPDTAWMLREDVGRTWDAVAMLDIAVDFLVMSEHLESLHALLRRRPALRGVIDHGAKPQIERREMGAWARAMTRLARDTNVACKLSGLVSEAGPNWTTELLRPYVDLLLTEFGPARLLFGSDWPVLNLAADYVRWYETANELLQSLSDGERSAVFGGNAATFYRL